MKQPILAANNELTLLPSGVWVLADEDQRAYIDYTDGDAMENAVFEVIKNAEDRSVDSLEFDQDWADWALEYHLTSKRANIYRGLNLSGVESVLEVGCGCGAITRFLGEQGFQVDSIEGSPRRAEMARLRTQELEKVQIICSNYHQLDLPAESYDLVVFTGVLEYSGAYASEGVSPEEQLILTLELAKAALSQSGSILIAIENRTGIKYINGASEDHLVVPHIGLLGYPESKTSASTRGIRTWSKKEWRGLLAGIEAESVEFAYPFPDYKVPQVVLSESFLETADHPEEVLNGIESADYGVPWLSPVSEPVFWKAAAQTGALGEFSNSFLIVVNKSKQANRHLVGFDFVRFPSIRRKPAYRQLVYKMKGEPRVRREAAVKWEADKGEARKGKAFVRHRDLAEEVYAEGRVLSQYWADMLAIYPTYDELGAYLRQYYAWLNRLFTDTSEPEALLDALPQNIIVGEDEEWILIDQEWQTKSTLTVDFVYFRAVLNFCLAYRHVLSGIQVYPQTQHINTIQDLLTWAFDLVDTSLKDETLKQFLDSEECFQSQIVLPDFRQNLSAVIKAPIYIGRINNQQRVRSLKPAKVEVYWSQVDEVWHEDHSVSVEFAANQPIRARLKLPKMIGTHRYIRIDPIHNDINEANAWLEFKRIEFFAITTSGISEPKLSVNSVDQLVGSARWSGLKKCEDGMLMVTSRDAQLVFDLNEVEWAEDLDHVQLIVEFNVVGDEKHAQRQAWVEEDNLLANRVWMREALIELQQERLDALLANRDAVAKEVTALESQRQILSQTWFGRMKHRLVKYWRTFGR